MLYNEFVEGTGCKDNEHNYKVYKDLEVMYTNSDMSKADIYEYGKKLVDNSKSEKELQIEAEIKAEIEGIKAEIHENKNWLSYYEEMVVMWKEEGDKNMVAMNKSFVKMYKERNKELRNKIKSLKWVLA